MADSDGEPWTDLEQVANQVIDLLNDWTSGDARPATDEEIAEGYKKLDDSLDDEDDNGGQLCIIYDARLTGGRWKRAMVRVQLLD